MGELVGLEIAMLSVSDAAADASASIGARLVEVGHKLHVIERADDEAAAVRARLDAWIADAAVDAVIVFSGDTAPTAPVTEAVTAVSTKPQPSFTQAFRTLAFKQIGNTAITTDAIAALCGSTIVIAVPAPAGALATAVEAALVAQLDSRTLPRNLATLLPKVKDALAKEALAKAPPPPTPIEHGPFATRTPPPPPPRSGAIPKLVKAEKTPPVPPPAPKTPFAPKPKDTSAIPRPVATTGTAPMRWGDFASGKYAKGTAGNAVPVKPIEAKPVEAKPIESKAVAAKPVAAKPVEAKPVEPKPVESKPVEAKPVEAKPVAAAPIEAKPIEAKPVEAKPAEPKPADAKGSETKRGDAGDGEGSGIEAKWLAASQHMPLIVDPPSGATPIEAEPDALVVSPKPSEPVVEAAKPVDKPVDEIPRPMSKEMAVPEEAVVAETAAPPPFKRRRPTTPPPPPPRAQTLDLEPDPEPDAPLPPSAPARAATTDDPPVFAINREDTWRVRRPTAPRNNRMFFYIAGAAVVIGVAIIVYMETRSRDNHAVAGNDRPAAPVVPEPPKPAPVETPDAYVEIEMSSDPPPIDAAAIDAAAIVAQRDPKPIKRTDPPPGPPGPPGPKDPPPTPKVPPDAAEAETKPPPPPNVPEGCDEVACILEKFARPCCAVWKKAEPPVEKPHVGIPATLDKGMIRAGVDRIKPLVIDCGTKAQLKGTVRVSVAVDADGRVTSADASEAPSAELGACVASAMQKAKFGKTENGGTFTYPFVF